MIRSSLLILASLCFGFSGLAAAEPAGTQSEILATYVRISAALAADNLADAKAAATVLADTAGMAKDKAVADQAAAVAKAADIASARESFKALSTTVEPLATGEKAYAVMYCPMAKADWVQMAGGVKNPYYGKSMLTCGTPKEASKASP